MEFSNLFQDADNHIPSPMVEKKLLTNSYPIELLEKYAPESPVAANLLKGKVYYVHALAAVASGGNYSVYNCFNIP